MNNFGEKVNFIWSLAEILRGDFRRHEYGRIILPLTVLRRLDCVVAPRKDELLETYEQMKDEYDDVDLFLRRAAGDLHFYNTSQFDFETLRDDPENIAANLRDYIHGFSQNAQDIMKHFEFDHYIDQLDRSNLLYHLIGRFCEIDLHPDVVEHMEMGYMFEELIRRFSEQSNETAGEHFTPREVIRLMVNLLFAEDEDVLSQPGIVRTMYDPACGTGGMLSEAQKYLYEMNPQSHLEVHGQELNPESFAICKADMIIKDHNPSNIQLGNSFTDDSFSDRTFDYMLTNPPFGVNWKKYADPIKEEHENLGHAGRFGAGTPRTSDGQLLFLQHMLSKMKNTGEGSRIATVFNGSPLFTGNAGSGESEIRRWIIDNDWLEAIIALPEELFYNTGIATYIWVLTNRKSEERMGKIQLIDATEFYKKMRKNLGDKRKELSDQHIREITCIYEEFEENEHCRIFDNTEFGYRKIRIDQPLRVNYAVTEERLERVKEENLFQKEAQSRKRDPEKKKREEEEGRKRQQAILQALRSIPEGPDTDDEGNPLYLDHDKFTDQMKKALDDAGLSLRASLRRAIRRGLRERDDKAKIVGDSRGNPKPDKDLRDYERVPIARDVYEYFEEEVKPHLPEAWIDESYTDKRDEEVGRVGYEINFNRYFYEYEPPRPLDEIESDIKALQGEISDLLSEVVQ